MIQNDFIALLIVLLIIAFVYVLSLIDAGPPCGTFTTYANKTECE